WSRRFWDASPRAGRAGVLGRSGRGQRPRWRWRTPRGGGRGRRRTAVAWRVYPVIEPWKQVVLALHGFQPRGVDGARLDLVKQPVEAPQVCLGPPDRIVHRRAGRHDERPVAAL